MKWLSFCLVGCFMVAGCTTSKPRSEPQAAAHGPQSGRDCFNVSMVNGFSSVDRDTVRLDAGPGQRYEADVSGPMCDQVDWAQQIALESRSSSWICTGDRTGQGNVYFRDPATRRRVSCYIDNVRRVADGAPHR